MITISHAAAPLETNVNKEQRHKKTVESSNPCVTVATGQSKNLGGLGGEARSEKNTGKRLEIVWKEEVMEGSDAATHDDSMRWLLLLAPPPPPPPPPPPHPPHPPPPSSFLLILLLLLLLWLLLLTVMMTMMTIDAIDDDDDMAAAVQSLIPTP